MKKKVIEISAEDTEALLERVKNSGLTQEDYEIIEGIIEAYVLLDQAVKEKNTSVKRLLKMIFGYKTEKKKNAQSRAPKKNKDEEKKKKTKGHGKNGADKFIGAPKVEVQNSTLNHCDPCPKCDFGKVYRLKEPGIFVRFTGTTPLQATVYELEKLRCNICGTIFTADVPGDKGKRKKYDATAVSMLALIHYGCGFPFNRLAQLQGAVGMPLAASTQWDQVEKLANHVRYIYLELIRQGAQGEIIHNDDTNMKVQELLAENKEKDPERDRTGVFTTGIISINHNHKIALFFTGRKHAGENMAQLLAQRQSLDPPIQMCDALAQNTSEDFQTILANCLTHGRRKFVDVADNFPEECMFVLDILGKVYHYDAFTSQENMTPKNRLLFHQANSGPLMEELHCWLKKQLKDTLVEPNSSLGKSIKYMLNHWKQLTLFLRVENAPLDNNICERALKMAIIHRKNSLFYKTANGAYIGDIFMSIIHTCALTKINPFDYLTALQENASAVFKKPHQWLPWNFQANQVPLAS